MSRPPLSALPNVTATDAERFLTALLDAPVANVALIGAGMFARAFAFDADGQALVLRVNSFEVDFQKDVLAWQRFASPALPIPAVISAGRYAAGLYYAVTRRCPGTTIERMAEDEERACVPSLLTALDAIHAIDASAYRGWGLTDGAGRGLFESWPEYLLSLYNQKKDYDWNALPNHPLLEWDVFLALYEEMRRFLDYCPAQKYLVHGDYGFDNVVGQAGQVTGVLDWAEMRLGDFLHDVANLDFYSKRVPYGDIWCARAAARGQEVPHFEERMRCYMLHIGLGAMLIAAANQDRRDYIREKARTESVLLPGRRSPTDWTQGVS
ncbi:MAG: aminoglycoside phosphotransferase family protein [Anaerolineae bacterium]